jgi:hypothetical protein
MKFAYIVNNSLIVMQRTLAFTGIAFLIKPANGKD